jgi:hypothetical protein
MSNTVPIQSANSMICKKKVDLLQDPNYFLRKHSTSFRIRLAMCRFLYRVQKLIIEKSIGLDDKEQRI